MGFEVRIRHELPLTSKNSRIAVESVVAGAGVEIMPINIAFSRNPNLLD